MLLLFVRDGIDFIFELLRQILHGVVHGRSSNVHLVGWGSMDSRRLWDALDNVAFGDALGDTDVAGTFAEEALGDGGVEESEILMCNTRFPNCFLKAPNFLSYSSFSSLTET